MAGHPEGFHEGFANIYSDAAEAISAAGQGIKRMPLGNWNVDPQPVDMLDLAAWRHMEVTFE